MSDCWDDEIQVDARVEKLLLLLAASAFTPKGSDPVIVVGKAKELRAYLDEWEDEDDPL